MNAPRPLSLGSNYLAFVKGVIELHKLAAKGRDDSLEADAVRDATDRPWEALSDIERARVSGLSEDLYSITDQPTPRREMNAQAQARLNDAIEARQAGDWDRALDLLRRWSKYIDPALLSYLRGSIWSDAGDIEVASLFYDHASRLEPENGNYLAVLLHTLDGIDPTTACQRSEAILVDPGAHPPTAVARAAGVVFKATRHLSVSDSAQAFRRLIPILRDDLARLEAGEQDPVVRSSHTMAAHLLGSTHEFLGETQAAYEAYSRGLRENPYYDALLVARGMLLYGTSPQAIADLELAAQSGSTLIWPYLVLAHHYLISGRFDQCRLLCERALSMPGQPTLKSELSEWKAISQSELGFPAELILASFEDSLRHDPANERARRNMVKFEAVRSRASEAWETRSTPAIRSWGLTALLIEQRLLMAA